MDYVITLGPRVFHDSATIETAATTKAPRTINCEKARCKATVGSNYLDERDITNTSNGLHYGNKA
jgi:hypothetical protein